MEAAPRCKPGKKLAIGGTGGHSLACSSGSRAVIKLATGEEVLAPVGEDAEASGESAQNDEVIVEAEVEPEEGRRAKVARAPRMPSAAEIAEHEANIGQQRAKMSASAHRATHKVIVLIPVISTAVRVPLGGAASLLKLPRL